VTREIVRAASEVDAIVDALIAPLAVPGRPLLSEEQI
jgi:hypothetical protein